MAKVKKQNYGDYIRSLTDDQMSVFLNSNMICDLCIHGAGCRDPYNMSRCIAGVTEYLGRERKVDDGQEKEEQAGDGAGSAGTDKEGRA